MRRLERRTLALGALFALVLLALTPVWHHGHWGPARTAPDPGAPRAHDGSGESIRGADACPVCLSHRLLTHVIVDGRCEAPAPASEFVAAATRSSALADGLAHAADARAPPLR